MKSRRGVVSAAVVGLLAVAVLVGGCDQKPSQPSAPAPRSAPAPSPSAPTPTPKTEGTQPRAGVDSTELPKGIGSGGDAIGVSDPIARTPGTLRLATYNLENLFDDKDDPKYSGKFEDIDDAKPVDQLKALAATIHKIDADVLAVEEVESEDTLKWFRDTYLADMGYRYVVSLDSGDERGIEQGVLSRFPLENAKVWPELPLGGVHPAKFGDEPNDYAGQPITYRRSPLRVDVVRPAEGADASAAPYRLTLFVVHHKSGRGGAYWREAEAKKAVELIGEAEAATPYEDNVIVLGDFNALARDDSVKTYLDKGFVPADKLAKADSEVKARKLKDSAWTTHASGRTIDMILLNPGVAKEFLPASMFVLSTPQRPRGSDWKTTPAPPGYASDHEPVVIDLVPRDK